jgi:hypothetical protein
VRATIHIRGTAPYVMNRFSKKAELMLGMATPKNQKKARTERKARDYAQEFLDCQHRAAAGWAGMPAPGFRKAMIDACRTVGLVMTTAKMSVFVIADGVDVADGTPLVRLIGGEPEQIESHVRNDNGSIDIRVRAMWREWAAAVTVEFDADMITAESVVNLLDRAGRQVGVGEGRPFSKNSVGQGWGTFTVVEAA